MKLTSNPEYVCPMRKSGGPCVLDQCNWFHDEECDITSIASSLEQISTTLNKLLSNFDPPKIIETKGEAFENFDIRPGAIQWSSPRIPEKDREYPEDDVPF